MEPEPSASTGEAGKVLHSIRGRARFADPDGDPQAGLVVASDGAGLNIGLLAAVGVVIWLGRDAIATVFTSNPAVRVATG